MKDLQVAKISKSLFIFSLLLIITDFICYAPLVSTVRSNKINYFKLDISIYF